MTRAQLKTMLAGGTWNNASEECRAAFARELRGQQRTRLQLINDWAWFYAGWVRAANALQRTIAEAGGPEHNIGCAAMEWADNQAPQKVIRT